MQGNVMNAMADLSGGVRDIARMKALIDRLPGHTAIVGAKGSGSGDRNEDSLRIGRIEKDAMKTHTACARLPRRTAAMLAKTGEDANITLEVRVSNIPAIKLYESYGFRSVGTRKRYYTDTGEDALIMWRTPATLQGRLDDVPEADPMANHRR